MIRNFRRPVRAASLLACLGLLPSLALAASPTAAQRAAEARRDAHAPTDRFIVRFREDAPEHGNAQARGRFLDGVGKHQGVRIAHGRRLGIGADLLRTDRKLDRDGAKRLLVALARHPGIEYVEIDALHLPQSNDPQYAQQWHLPATTGIGADLAWNRGTGAGVVVAVVDTGLTAHADLAANRVAGYDFIGDTARSNDGNGRDSNANDPGDAVAYSECNNTSSAYDSSWHGTAVAGVIAAVANNGVGGAGIAPAAKIMPVRVSGKCGAYTSDIVDGIKWAAGGSVPGVPSNPNPAEVINVSLVKGDADVCSPSAQAAINQANAVGAVVVVSAGNFSYGSPSNCAGVIVVNQAAENDGIIPIATSDAIPDLQAPDTKPGQYSSTHVLTTTDLGLTAPTGDGYAEYRGTSIAAAMVSGTVALMQGIRPHSPALVESLLRVTARPQLKPCSNCGAGVVDAAAATRAASIPVLWFPAPATAAEGAAGATHVVAFDVQLSEPLATPVTFVAQTANGTATGGTDFVALAPTTFTIAPGATRKLVNVTVNGDGSFEGDEDFTLVVSNVKGIDAIDTQARAVIANDDLAELRPDKHADLVGPSSTPARYFFNVPAGATNVYVRTIAWQSGSAGDADLYVRKGSQPTRTVYDCASTTVGNNERCDLVAAAGLHFVLVDTLSSYERVSVYVNWTVGGTSTETALTLGDARVVEGDSGTKTAYFTVTRAKAGTSDVTFKLATHDGTALAGSDYVARVPSPNSGYYMASFQTSTSVGVTINGDTDVEANEAFTLELVEVVGASVADGVATAVIANNDGPALSIADVAATETDANQQVTLTATLSQPAAVPVTFNWTTTAGSAVAATDFIAASGSKTIPAGTTSTTWKVTVKGDAVVELAEDFFVDLTSSTGATLLDPQARVLVGDDDLPQVGVADAYITEGTSGITMGVFTVALSRAAPYPVAYTIRTLADTGASAATPKSDYGDVWQQDVIAAGTLGKTFYVPVYGDQVVEPNQKFLVELDGVDPALATVSDGNAAGWIVNDEGARLSVRDASVVEGNAGTRGGTVTVSLNQAVAGTVTFYYATATGSAVAGDFVEHAPVAATIPAGQLNVTVPVTVNGDTAVEGNETFSVVLTSSSGNATIFDREGVVTLLNDDGPTLSIDDVQVVEGASGQAKANFTVRLSQVAAVPVTYAITTANGSAASGSDYVARTLAGETIAAGQLSRTFAVNVNGDTAVEANESFTATITSATGASRLDPQATATIVNDDGPTVSVLDATTTEGATGTKSLTFTVQLSQALAAPLYFDFASADGSATVAGNDYVARLLTGQSIPAGMVSKTFAVSVRGDTVVEADEAFTVNLGNVSGPATAYDAQAIGTITNDD